MKTATMTGNNQEARFCTVVSILAEQPPACIHGFNRKAKRENTHHEYDETQQVEVWNSRDDCKPNQPAVNTHHKQSAEECD